MIRLEGVWKSFGPKTVLAGVDLHIPRGTSLVLIGGSGTGKSVTLKHIIGLLLPDRGRVYVAGQEVAVLRDRELMTLRRKIGMLFQGAALFDSLSVWENVGFGLLQHTKLSPAKVRKIASEKLRLVGLRGFEDRMPADLSGGMKKRVGLARAIAMDPEIILYDEPTTGLDPIMGDVINKLIVDLKHRLEVTSFTITHDMSSAYQIADTIAMLYQGKIIEQGTPEQIRNTSNPIVRQFVTGAEEGPFEVA
jgi:phospholipid/cholesterol/gamma-HCH transport system ATP-binding protein